MNHNGRPVPPDLGLFEENQRKYPSDQLRLHAGKHIAWSLDGSRILASGDSLEEVDQRLTLMGVHFSQVVHDYVDDL
jgi:hypothetical protein